MFKLVEDGKPNDYQHALLMIESLRAENERLRAQNKWLRERIITEILEWKDQAKQMLELAKSDGG